MPHINLHHLHHRHQNEPKLLGLKMTTYLILQIIGYFLLIGGISFISSVTIFLLYKQLKHLRLKDRIVNRYQTYLNSEEYVKDKLAGSERDFGDHPDHIRNWCSEDEWKNIEHTYSFASEIYKIYRKEKEEKS